MKSDGKRGTWSADAVSHFPCSGISQHGRDSTAVTKLMEMHGDNTTEDVGMEMEREDEEEAGEDDNEE